MPPRVFSLLTCGGCSDGYVFGHHVSTGGGGRGMRLVTKQEDVLPLYRQAMQEAEAAFGNGAVYIERCDWTHTHTHSHTHTHGGRVQWRLITHTVAYAALGLYHVCGQE